MEKQFDLDALELLIDTRQFRALRDALAERNEVDIAQFLGELEPEKAVLAFRTLPKEATVPTSRNGHWTCTVLSRTNGARKTSPALSYTSTRRIRIAIAQIGRANV